MRLRGHERLESETAAPASRAASLFRLAGLLGPYLMIELLLPGGSLIALLLWLLRRIHRSTEHVPAARQGTSRQN
jgi:hypothetical protein